MKKIMLCTLSLALVAGLCLLLGAPAKSDPMPVAPAVLAMPVQASGGGGDALPFDPNESCPDSGILPDPPWCGSCQETGWRVTAEDAANCAAAFSSWMDEICANARKAYDARMKKHTQKIQSYTSEAIACIAHATTPAAQQACVDQHTAQIAAEDASYVVDMTFIHLQASTLQSQAKSEYRLCMLDACKACTGN